VGKLGLILSVPKVQCMAV